ncbi:MAG: serine hydrolase domain-containing protein [Gemmatimonadaceae bacterium]
MRRCPQFAVRFVSFLAFLGALSSQTVEAQQPASRFAADRLARIDRFMQQYVDSNRIGGAVGFVMIDGKIAYQHAVGWADKDANRRMTAGAMFRIASQTKAITSVALLSLVEEGKIAVSDPVSKYIPSFAHSRVMLDTGNNVIVPARRAITIRDLLTHTAGISYGVDRRVASIYAEKGFGTAAGYGWYTADKNEDICDSMERLGTLPFVAQPGTRFVYGYNLDVLGCVIERVSGMGLDKFIRERVTAPLKMNDTYFFLPTEKRNRLVEVFASDSSDHAVRAPDGARGQGHYVDGPRKSFAGGAGLVSTAGDYARFLQMILNGGQLDGVRILAPTTVALMTHDQIGAIYGTAGLGFGFGFETVEKFGAKGMFSAGTFAWGGAYGSAYQVDPSERLIMVFMINQVPISTDIATKFSTLVYSALMNKRN